jgi:hypothetical protein
MLGCSYQACNVSRARCFVNAGFAAAPGSWAPHRRSLCVLPQKLVLPPRPVHRGLTAQTTADSRRATLLPDLVSVSQAHLASSQVNPRSDGVGPSRPRRWRSPTAGARPPVATTPRSSIVPSLVRQRRPGKLWLAAGVCIHQVVLIASTEDDRTIADLAGGPARGFVADGEHGSQHRARRQPYLTTWPTKSGRTRRQLADTAQPRRRLSGARVLPAARSLSETAR